MNGYAIDASRLRPPGIGLLGATVVLAHLPIGVGLPCPLRTLTGVPCPFCGTTTALRALGGGHVTQSLAAAPLSVTLVAASLVAVTKRLPARLIVPWPIVVAGIGGEWVFELFRFHVL
jgi:hypothetical protein